MFSSSIVLDRNPSTPVKGEIWESEASVIADCGQTVTDGGMVATDSL